MASVQAIPLVELEEPHEALLVWRSAVRAGKLPSRGNELLQWSMIPTLAPASLSSEAFASIEAGTGEELLRTIQFGLNPRTYLSVALGSGVFSRWAMVLPKVPGRSQRNTLRCGYQRTEEKVYVLIE